MDARWQVVANDKDFVKICNLQHLEKPPVRLTKNHSAVARLLLLPQRDNQPDETRGYALYARQVEDDTSVIGQNIPIKPFADFPDPLLGSEVLVRKLHDENSLILYCSDCQSIKIRDCHGLPPRKSVPGNVPSLNLLLPYLLVNFPCKQKPAINRDFVFSVLILCELYASCMSCRTFEVRAFFLQFFLISL